MKKKLSKNNKNTHIFMLTINKNKKTLPNKTKKSTIIYINYGVKNVSLIKSAQWKIWHWYILTFETPILKCFNKFYLGIYLQGDIKVYFETVETSSKFYFAIYDGDLWHKLEFGNTDCSKFTSCPANT